MILFKLNEVKNSQSKYQYFNKFAYLWPFNRHLLARDAEIYVPNLPRKSSLTIG